MQQERREELCRLNLKLSIKIEELLTYLGFSIDDYYFSEDGIRGPAMCHDGQNSTGWSFYSNSSRTWKCWTNHCHEHYGCRPIGLIRAVFKCSFSDALIKAKEFLDNHNDTNEEAIDRILKEQENKKEKIKINYWNDHLNPTRVFQESLLDNLKPASSFEAERGLGLFNQYKIGIADKGILNRRVVVPIRNIRGSIIGFSGRTLDKDNKMKWCHFPSSKNGFKTSLSLFNIHNAFSFNIENGLNTYVLTEGPFDSIKLQMSGIKNSVCTFGNSISDGQIEVLKQAGAAKILIAYDGDEPGQQGSNRVKKKLEKNLIEVQTVSLKDHFPMWDESCGQLDWANKLISTEAILRIFKEYEN